MENASKALLMAGGVLIAMAIIGLAVAAFMHATDFARDNEDAMSASQIESFNRFYTAYLTTYDGASRIRCIDAVNILNRAIEDELEIVENSSLISPDDGFYKAEPVNYLSGDVSYSLEYNPAVGVVEKIIIGN